MPDPTPNAAVTAAQFTALADLANGKLSPGIAYAFDGTVAGMLAELNRLRNVLFQLIFREAVHYAGLSSGIGMSAADCGMVEGAPSPLHFKKEAIFSGPWVVGINDPVNYPDADGKLYDFKTDGIDDQTGFDTKLFPFFTEVEFCFLETAAPDGFGITSGWTHKLLKNLAAESTHFELSLAFTAAPGTHIVLDISLASVNHGGVDGHPPDTHLVATTNHGTVTIPLGGPANIHVEADIPESGTLDITADWISGGADVRFTAQDYTVSIVSETDAVTTSADIEGLHPAGELKKISVPPLIFDGRLGTSIYQLSDDSVPGCWLAKTLPTPAINPFLDAQIPPHVRRLSPGRAYADEVANSIRTTDADGFGFGQTLDRTGLNQLAPYPDKQSPELRVSELIELSDNATTTGQFWFPGQFSKSIDPTFSHVTAPDTDLPVYFSLQPGINPADAGTYGFMSTTTPVTAADMVTGLGIDLKRGAVVYFLVKNNSGGAVALGLTWYDYRQPKLAFVDPAIKTIAARWPCVRDTANYPVYAGNDPYRYSQRYADGAAITLPPGAAVEDIFLFWPGISVSARGLKRFRLRHSGDTPLPIYVARDFTGFVLDDPYTWDAHSDFHTTNGEVLIPTDGGATYLAALAAWSFKIINTTAAPVTIRVYDERELYDENSFFQPLPVFIPLRGDAKTPLEAMSYHLQEYIETNSITSGELSAGAYYRINFFVAGDDFTNCGAASNATGISFVATATTPTVWTHKSELRSYNQFSDQATRLENNGDSVNRLPQLGHCVFDVFARRVATGSPKSAPSAGKAEIKVKVGVFRGVKHSDFFSLSKTSGTLEVGQNYTITSYVDGDDFIPCGASGNDTGISFTATATTPGDWTHKSELFQGKFEEFTELTIPADAAESEHSRVFWPVVMGQPLAYQADEPVEVIALANWQPPFHCDRYNVYRDDEGVLLPPSNPRYFNAMYFRTALKFFNLFSASDYGYPFVQPDEPIYITVYNAEVDAYNAAHPGDPPLPHYDAAVAEDRQRRRVQYPLAAVVVNDLTALLNIIP